MPRESTIRPQVSPQSAPPAATVSVPAAGLLERANEVLSFLSGKAEEAESLQRAHANAVKLAQMKRNYYDQLAARALAGGMTKEQIRDLPDWEEAELLKALNLCKWEDLQKSGADDAAILQRLASKWPDHNHSRGSEPGSFWRIQKDYRGGKFVPTEAAFCIASEEPAGYYRQQVVVLVKLGTKEVIGRARALLTIGPPAKAKPAKKSAKASEAKAAKKPTAAKPKKAAANKPRRIDPIEFVEKFPAKPAQTTTAQKYAQWKGAVVNALKKHGLAEQAKDPGVDEALREMHAAGKTPGDAARVLTLKTDFSTEHVTSKAPENAPPVENKPAKSKAAPVNGKSHPKIQKGGGVLPVIARENPKNLEELGLGLVTEEQLREAYTTPSEIEDGKINGTVQSDEGFDYAVIGMEIANAEGNWYCLQQMATEFEWNGPVVKYADARGSVPRNSPTPLKGVPVQAPDGTQYVFCGKEDQFNVLIPKTVAATAPKPAGV